MPILQAKKTTPPKQPPLHKAARVLALKNVDLIKEGDTDLTKSIQCTLNTEELHSSKDEQKQKNIPLLKQKKAFKVADVPSL